MDNLQDTAYAAHRAWRVAALKPGSGLTSGVGPAPVDLHNAALPEAGLNDRRQEQKASLPREGFGSCCILRTGETATKLGHGEMDRALVPHVPSQLPAQPLSRRPKLLEIEIAFRVPSLRVWVTINIVLTPSPLPLPLPF